MLTDNQQALNATPINVVQTETTDRDIVVAEENSPEIRTLNECLAVYESQVKYYLYNTIIVIS